MTVMTIGMGLIAYGDGGYGMFLSAICQ